MRARRNNIRARGRGAGRSAPRFDDGTEWEAHRVEPLRQDDAGPWAARGRLTSSWLPGGLALALAVVAAGAAGTLVGYVTSGQPDAAEPQAAATKAASVPAQPQPAHVDATDASARAGGAPRARVATPARDETKHPEVKGDERRGRNEEWASESAREMEGRRREGEKKLEERLREEARKRAERLRELGKGGKGEARLIGVISDRPRP